MLDETQEAPAETTDDAVDLADMGAAVETADEPAVTAEELMDIPDAPEMPGREPEKLTHMIADEADTPAVAEAAASDDTEAVAEDAADDAPADDAAGEDS